MWKSEHLLGPTSMELVPETGKETHILLMWVMGEKAGPNFPGPRQIGWAKALLSKVMANAILLMSLISHKTFHPASKLLTIWELFKVSYCPTSYCCFSEKASADLWLFSVSVTKLGQFSFILFLPWGRQLLCSTDSNEILNCWDSN